MSTVAGIEFLKGDLIAVESERRKIQAAMARLPQLDAEYQAIKLLLAKHTGETGKLPYTAPPSQYVTPGNSVSSLVVRALKEAGKPQKTEQLLAFLESHGKPTSSATLRSTIHQNAKRGKVFKSVTPGLYGLVEWQ